jgi:hypothetical protein
VLENKQSREINDSEIIMISMTYDQQCETLRFAKRNIRFAKAQAGPHIATSLKVTARKKLRKRAAKPLKLLTPVNLRAHGLPNGLGVPARLARKLPI